MALTDPLRTLAALGHDTVPALVPLSYPGRPATAPSLLLGDELLDLDVRGPDPARWTVPGRGPLDRLLTAAGGAGAAERTPVVAVGSNAAPAQVAYKLRRTGLPVAVPMVPLPVDGVAVGCSAHIGLRGYVAAAPYPAPAERRTLVVSWLDAEQLAAVDATEEPNYRRVPLGPAGGLQLYVSEHGVLVDPGTGAPRPGGGDQAALLRTLLAGSAALRTLLGPEPEDWVRAAAASASVREEGTRLLHGLPRTASGPR
ncbi:hypothetical protein [Streptomyces beihaiensis]|uniref:Uncharacterized protein n=1 Tax=Streptomyces beihaiensis TaxID=2984495 RepID=A0ABT3U7G2_9ACTN|nr:hypothetical protein [Streptomyces beihaiensis]MCX3064123.1 hypothetical protein [Streptomyces beihaiensis]